MFKQKKEETKKLYNYKITIYFSNGNVVLERASNETREEIANYYYKVLSNNEAFEYAIESRKQNMIFNPNNIIFISVEEEDIEIL